MIPRIRLSILPLLLLAACGRAGPPPTVGDVAGCWLLRWGQGDSLYFPMPDSVWLDSTTEGTGGRRRVAFAGWRKEMGTRRIGDPIPWYRHYFASSWRMGTADSVLIDFNDNWTRWDTRLRLRRNRLSGTGRFRADFEPAPPPPVPVRGRRIPCPTPAP
jgi:hypothetical protein